MAKTLRVLIVEDGQEDIALLGQELRHAGYNPKVKHVATVEDLRAALDSPWHVILTDYHLPQLDALTVLRIVREHGLDLPVIVISGSVGEDVAVAAMRAGAADYFRKEHLMRLGPAIDRELREAATRKRAFDLERQFADVFMSAPVPIAIFEGPNLVYRFVNPAYQALFGKRPLLGRQLSLATPELMPQTEGLARALSGEVVSITDAPLSISTNSGPPRDLFFNATYQPLRGAEESLARVLVTTVDVTREVQGRLAAEGANRMKDDFLATLSHELRTPLNAILGWALMLKQGMLDPAKQARAVDTIERSARHQVQLIEDLLDVSRIVSGKMTIRPRRVELVAVIDAAVDSVRLMAESKPVSLRVNVVRDGGIVYGDPERLQQVFWNLLSNAIKFTGSGGSVDVTMTREGSMGRVLVSDTGIGIPKDFLSHMFERFRQADPSSTRRHGGLGIGLAIVHHIVELHGGTITAESAGENAGATFTVVLPLRGPRMTTTQPDSASGADLRGIAVLVVDDDPDSRELIATSLHMAGAVVRTTGTAADALRELDVFTPTILISDIGLPDQSGLSLIRVIRERQKTRGIWMPAIALTAYASSVAADEATRADFQVHVPKPVEPDRLARIVRDLCLRHAR